MSAELAHRHGRHVHEHASAGVHRHLYAPRASSELGPEAVTATAPRTHGHDAGHSHAGHSHAADDRDRDREHDHHPHGHSHGLVDASILRSRAGIRAVGASLAILAVTAGLQALLYLASGSVALLADLIHNAGDAATAVPLAIAFLLRSARAERRAGLAVVAAIVISACVALAEAIERLIEPQTPTHLWLLAGAGLIGFVGNELAAQVRLGAGRRLESAALIADGRHARIDGLVSLAVVASAALVAAGARLGDPVLGLLISLVILNISRQSWTTVRRSPSVREGEAAGGASRR